MTAFCSKNSLLKINQYINGWINKGYKDGIPDEAPIELEKNLLVPSYRMICRAIMKNDSQLITLGYEREYCQMYNIIKKEELKRSCKIFVIAIQLGLFGETYECIR